MNIDLVNKLSELSIIGYLDPSNGYVTVWFYNNEKTEKSDVVAYLMQDMVWDLREVIGESSILKENMEVIKIAHSSLGKFEKESDFDVMVRKMLINSIEASRDNDDIIPDSVLAVEKILRNNSYDNSTLN